MRPVVRNLVIEKYATQNQQGTVDASAGTDWIISDNTIQLNHGAAVVGGTRSQIARNHLNYNGQHGIGATGDDVLVDQNEIAYNNTTGVSTAWSAGGSKFALTNRLTVRRNCVHDNNGPGLWTDIDNRGTLYEKNLVYSNTEVGIYHEISFDAIIRGNTVADNGSDSPGWVFGAQIMISTSSNVEVYNNKVQTAADYGHAITIAAQPRADWKGLDNYIHHNEITFLGSGGQVAVASDIPNYSSTLYSRNRIDFNTYHVSSLQDGHWGWDNALQNWDSLRSYPGVEANGQTDTNVVPLTFDCADVLTGN